MRSKSDPISMLKDRMLGSNMASVEELKVRAPANATVETGQRWRETPLEAPPPAGAQTSSDLMSVFKCFAASPSPLV